MIVEIILFIVALVLLVKGSEYLIKAAAAIAKILRVSDFIIGLSLVALGTSIPELASSVAAALLKDSGLIVGNIVGSNIANIGLIAGIVASIYYVKTKPTMLKRDGYIMMFASVLFFLFALDFIVSRTEGIVFIFFYIIYMMFLFEEEPKDHIRQFIKYFFKFQYLATIKSRVFYYNHKKKFKQKGKVKKLIGMELLRELGIVLLGGAAVVIGAHYLVKEAVFFAYYFNVPSNIIGLSLIALGTSLPELMVSLTAARKGFGDIAVGNVIGSNIANIFLVGGVAAVILPLEIIKSTIYYTLPFMLLMSVLLLISLGTGLRIKKWEGMVLLFFYILFIVLLLTGVLF